MKIDKVFVINLEHRTDRREQIIEELKRVGIDNYEIFKAIQPTEETMKIWNPNFIIPMHPWFKMKNKNGDVTKYRIGALGCMLSHLEIIKKCVENNYENVLILEDDTIFKIDNGWKFDTIMSVLDSQIKDLNFGLLYLTGNHKDAILEKKTDNITQVKGSLTTGSYIINKRVMKCIVDEMIHFPLEIDLFYSRYIHKQYPCYCIMPHLAGQRDGYSDIVQKNVSYRL